MLEAIHGTVWCSNEIFDDKYDITHLQTADGKTPASYLEDIVENLNMLNNNFKEKITYFVKNLFYA